jgi:hypothetical protein
MGLPSSKGNLRDCGCFELHTEVEITKKQNPSVDFSLLGVAYGFLSQRLRFSFGSHKHLIKVLDVWFAVEIFKIQRQDWIFIIYFCLF